MLEYVNFMLTINMLEWENNKIFFQSNLKTTNSL